MSKKNLTKAAMIAALKEVGITICGERRMVRDDVARYYDARFNQPATKKEENTMTTNPVALNTVPAAETAEPAKKERKPRQKLGFTENLYTVFQQTAEDLGCTVLEYRNTLFAKNGKHRVYKICYVRQGFNLFPKPEFLDDIKAILIKEKIPFEQGKNVKYDMQDWFTLSEEGAILALRAMTE